MTVERGIDPRRFALLPFGGAGPMHAAALADELGIPRIVCPRASGVLSALGLIAAGRRRDTARTVLLAGEQISAERVAAEVARAGRARRRGPGRRRAGGRLRAALPRASPSSCRSRARPSPTRAELRRGLRRASTRRATAIATPRAELELVNVRVAAAVPGPEPRRGGGGRRGLRARRPAPARIRRRVELETRVLRGEPAAGFEAAGPCVFELPEATLVLAPAGAPGSTRRERSSRSARRRDLSRGGGPAVDPVTLQVLAGALRAACEEMGAVLIRSAHSAEHQGAPRLLDRAVRRERRAGDAGRAHPGPPRLDARRGRRGRRRAPGRGRPLDPQRPLPRRHPPSRHHAGLARVRSGRERRADRVRRQPRAPRRRRRRDARPGCRPPRPASNRRASSSPRRS